MFPGCCCIANRHSGARERRQLIPHVRFQVPFLGPESQLKSGFACAGLLCTMSRYRLTQRVPSTVAITAMANGGRSCDVKGVSSPQSRIAAASVGIRVVP